MEYRFIPDQPLKVGIDDKTIQFGHKRLIEGIEKIVLLCPSPYTIGLFGSWGSGKSTIAECLKESLKNKKIGTIIFDVWKHEGDSLRRAFLIEMVKQLKELGNNWFNKDYSLSTNLYATVKITFEKLQFEWKRIGKFSLIILIFSILTFIILISAWLIFVEWLEIIEISSRIFKLIFGLFLSPIPIGFIIKLIDYFIKVRKEESIIEPYQDPHQFEIEFEKILKEIKFEKILIVFDNLDRVQGKIAMKIISTIKTFLEPEDIKSLQKEIVFLIPADHIAIRQHISKTLYSQEEDNVNPDEFLKKFFNTQIWIPDFYEIEIERFTINKLKYTKVPELDNETLAWLIARVFHKNPRQIIQFINVLLSNYLIMKERIGEGIDEEFLHNNVPQLAKFLLLIQAFPNVMDWHKKMQLYNLHNFSDEELNKTKIPTSEIDDYNKFLVDSKDILIESLEIFYTYRITEQEQKIPGSSNLFYLIREGTKEEYLKVAKELLNKDNWDDFCDIIQKQLQQIQISISVAKYINTILLISQNLDKNLKPKNYIEFENKLSNVCLEHIENLDPSILFNVFFKDHKTLPLKNKRHLVGELIKKISKYVNDPKSIHFTKEYLIEFFHCLKKFPETIFDKDYSILKDALAKGFSNDLIVANIFIDESEAQTRFFNNDFIKNFIESINNDDIDKDNDVKDRLELFSKIDLNLVNNENQVIIINKFIGLLSIENTRSINERKNEREILLRLMTTIYRKLILKKSDQIDPQSFNKFFEGINQGYINSRWAGSNFYMPLILEIEYNGPQSLKDRCKQLKRTFFDKSEANGILWLKKEVEDYFQIEEDEEIMGSLDRRILQTQDFIIDLYPNFTGETKFRWLKILLNDLPDPTRFTTFIEEKKYKIPQATLLAKEIQNKIDELPQPLFKANLFNTLNKLKIKRRNINIQLLKNQVLGLLKNNDQKYHQVGYEVLRNIRWLNRTEKRIISEEVFDYQKNQNTYYPYLVKCIDLFYNEMNEDRKSDFQQYLLHELVFRYESIESISLSNELLNNKQLSFEKRKTNLEEIKAKIEGGTNFQAEMINCLKTVLKNMRDSKGKNEFEKWIKKFE